MKGVVGVCADGSRCHGLHHSYLPVFVEVGCLGLQEPSETKAPSETNR